MFHESMMAQSLWQMKILYKDFKDYFTNVTETLTSHIENNAAELGRPVKYLTSASIKKEDEAKAFLHQSPERFKSILFFNPIQLMKD